MEEIMVLKSSFNSFFLHHIHRDRNDTSDKLSKEGLHHNLGSWKIIGKS